MPDHNLPNNNESIHNFNLSLCFEAKTSASWRILVSLESLTKTRY